MIYLTRLRDLKVPPKTRSANTCATVDRYALFTLQEAKPMYEQLYEGQVMTVEPGCYFNTYLLEPVKDSPHINHELLQKYLLEGGVRIGTPICST